MGPSGTCRTSAPRERLRLTFLPGNKETHTLYKKLALASASILIAAIATAVTLDPRPSLGHAVAALPLDGSEVPTDVYLEPLSAAGAQPRSGDIVPVHTQVHLRHFVPSTVTSLDSDLAGAYTWVGDRPLRVDGLIFGITRDGDLGFAHLSGWLDDDEYYRMENVRAFVRLVERPSDMVGSFLRVPANDGSSSSERLLVETLLLAVDVHGYLISQRIVGFFESSGSRFEYERDMESLLLGLPFCCGMHMGFTSCEPVDCSGSCGQPPVSCFCSVQGTCYGPTTVFCWGNCGEVHQCPPGACANWIDPQGQAQCKCRASHY